MVKTFSSITLASDITFVVVNSISIIASIVLFYLFGRKNREEPQIQDENKGYSSNDEACQPSPQQIDMKARIAFVRRTMLGMCVSDVLQSITNILQIAWEWMYDKYNFSDYRLYYIGKRVVLYLQTATTMSSAVWCLCIAIALMVTVKNKSPHIKMYEVLFHIFAWGIGLVFFLLWISLVVVEYVFDLERYRDVIIALQGSYNFLNGSFIVLTALVHAIILVFVWRRVSITINKVRLGLNNKKALSLDLRVILRFGSYLIPYVICDSFQVAYYFVWSDFYFRTQDERNAPFTLAYFLNGFYGMHGLLNIVIYVVGLDRARPYFNKLNCFCRRREESYAYLDD
ncbi:cAMP receptor [Acrasis kona]|uniref:cAMP receptor n=1 Tax=Acrasis kona TaxID=1008807 RepID=A0AAW2Z359_9EUKA